MRLRRRCWVPPLKVRLAELTVAWSRRSPVTYRSPTPIGAPLIFRARLDQREERKLHMSATAHTRDGLELIAEATATFIVIPIEHFMPDFTAVQE